MSTLWTPSGEHPIPRKPAGAEAGTTHTRREAEPPRPTAPMAGGAGPVAGTGAAERPGDDGPAEEWEPTAEELEDAKAEMDAVREQLLHAPVELVVSNHAMGLWELAALHLSQSPPQLRQAQLAIDALSALLQGLQGRLGASERTLSDGLAELRMAFVHIANAERARQADGGGGAAGAPAT